jgi:hypothetical protein
MQQNEREGEASAREGSLSPRLRKLARGYNLDKPFLELEVRIKPIGVEVPAIEPRVEDFLETLQESLGLEILDEEECPSSQGRSSGLGFEWTVRDFCLGRWASDVHVHGHVVEGYNTAGSMYRLEVSFVKMLEA